MQQYTITDSEFESFRIFIHQVAGIRLRDEHKTLVVNRLSERLQRFSLTSFTDYFNTVLATNTAVEMSKLVDLLTTNETYFFREPQHFSFLTKVVLPAAEVTSQYRVWSAAASTGEEAYSIAMLLDDSLGQNAWTVTGSDISQRAIATAKSGCYRQSRIHGIPRQFLRKYCVKGVGKRDGDLLIDTELKENIDFYYADVKEPLSIDEKYDVIFIRNALIYFDLAIKQLVINQLIDQLQQGGYLFVGHHDTMKGIHSHLSCVAPTIFRKK